MADSWHFGAHRRDELGAASREVSSRRPGPGCPQLTSLLNNLEESRHIRCFKDQRRKPEQTSKGTAGKQEGRNWDSVWGSTNPSSHGELIHSKGREVRRERTAERLNSNWADGGMEMLLCNVMRLEPGQGYSGQPSLDLLPVSCVQGPVPAAGCSTHTLPYSPPCNTHTHTHTHTHFNTDPQDPHEIHTHIVILTPITPHESFKLSSFQVLPMFHFLMSLRGVTGLLHL